MGHRNNLIEGADTIGIQIGHGAAIHGGGTHRREIDTIRTECYVVIHARKVGRIHPHAGNIERRAEIDDNIGARGSVPVELVTKDNVEQYNVDRWQ